MNTQIHPHKVIADFMNKYELRIKPHLKKGDLENTKIGIGDICLRGQFFLEDKHRITPMKEGVYGKYKMAINYLTGIMYEKNVDKNLLEYLFNSIDRFVGDLDFILHDDPNYKIYRN